MENEFDNYIRIPKIPGYQELLDEMQGVAKESTSQTILTAVNNILPSQQAIAECYEIAQEKGLTIPAPSQQTMSNLPATMETIVAEYQTPAIVSYAAIVSSPLYTYMSFAGMYFTGSMNELFNNNTNIIKVDALQGDPTSIESLFASATNLEWVNMIGLKGSNITNVRNAFYGTHFDTLVGDLTIDDVIDENISVFEGINIDIEIAAWHNQSLNRQSLRAIINGLADRTGQSSLTFAMGSTNLARLTSDDIAVATNKNWNLTS